MTSYGLERVHAELYEVLGDVVRVLEENGLPYSAMCGTLLGAVRHGAIIPWDDDVDLVLPRASYDRFEEIYPSQCGLGFVLDLSDTWVPRARKVGGDAFVDLFVLDPLPRARLARLWKLLRLRVLQGTLKQHTEYARFSLPKRLALWATHALGLPFARESKLRAYRRVARSGRGENAHLSNGAFSLLGMSFAATAFDDPVRVPFGPIAVRVPRDAGAVLTRLYGKHYMTPPPEDERRPVHLDR